MKKILLMIGLLLSSFQVLAVGVDLNILNPMTGRSQKVISTDTVTMTLPVELSTAISIDSATITSDTTGLLGKTDFENKVDTKTSEIYNKINEVLTTIQNQSILIDSSTYNYTGDTLTGKTTDFFNKDKTYISTFEWEYNYDGNGNLIYKELK